MKKRTEINKLNKTAAFIASNATSEDFWAIPSAIVQSKEESVIIYPYSIYLPNFGQLERKVLVSM